MDLASRFRPTNIDEMIGQQKIVEVFKKFLKEKRVPHSLFFGTPGSGKTSLAKLIASTLGAEFYEFDGANFKTEQIRSIIGKNPLF
ncbi:MAG: AAA family ATPase, partial [Campylobacter sp.]|nr:AAA family ATPase [Campylobacter sp.]